VQHPLEPAIQVKVQTKSENPGPVQAVEAALGSLQHELGVLEKSFDKELAKKGGGSTDRAGRTGGEFDPMSLG
jgi:DNA-directed RNA polymerase subunit L